MNRFGKALSEDKFDCAPKGINVMRIPLLMARNTHSSENVAHTEVLS